MKNVNEVRCNGSFIIIVENDGTFTGAISDGPSNPKRHFIGEYRTRAEVVAAGRTVILADSDRVCTLKDIDDVRGRIVPENRR